MDAISASSAEPAVLSQSIQTYLVEIARLQVGDRPVPLSLLANELSYSSVSVNEMCRKLQDQELLTYEPYRGVCLTSHGLRWANYVLRRHRLWEVFLVDYLDLPQDEAHEAACLLEHATPGAVADHLDRFLGHPTANPLGEPIPSADGKIDVKPGIALARASVGQTCRVVENGALPVAHSFLESAGIRGGATVRILSATDDCLLVQVEEHQLPIALQLAEQIVVAPVPAMRSDTTPSSLAAERDADTRGATFDAAS